MRGLVFASALACSFPLNAGSGAIDASGKTTGAVAASIARQGGISIAFRDSRLSQRPAPAIRGSDAVAALRQLAAATDLKVVKVGRRAFLLEANRAPPASRPRAPLARPRAAVVAAPPAIGVGEAIVITASKRAAASDRYGGQYALLDGRVFEGLGPVGTDEVARRTLGLSSTHLGAGRNKLFIRGIADSSFSGPTQSPVGQYLGEMRTGYSGPDPDLRIVDMERVELLEGPQGTLYGSGAIGGIVRLSPRPADPAERSLALSSGASATRHGAPGHDLAGIANLPLGPAAAVRLVGYRAHEGGYLDRGEERDSNAVRIAGGRAHFAAHPGEDWTLEANLVGQSIRAEDAQYVDGDTGLARSAAPPLPNGSDYRMASLVARRETGAVRIVASAGTIWHDIEERFDASLDDAPRVIVQLSRARAFSSEMRAYRPMENGSSWLLGASLLSHDLSLGRTLDAEGQESDLAGTRNRVDEWTLYGDGALELARGVELGAGARLARTRLDGSGEHLAPAMAMLAPATFERTEWRLLPSASLVVRPVEGTKAFARYQHGFRPGGLTIEGENARHFRHDLVRTAEIGFESDVLGDRSLVSASLSHSRWSDIQADYLDIGGLPVTNNIGNGRVISASLAARMALSPHWHVEAGVAWNDGKITEPNGALLAGLSMGANRPLPVPNVARALARGALDYRTGLGGGWSLQGDLDVRYVGTSYLGVGPRLGDRQGGYADSSASLRVVRGGLGVSLSLTNLLDARGNRFAFGNLIEGGNAVTPQRPRTLRLGADWSL